MWELAGYIEPFDEQGAAPRGLHERRRPVEGELRLCRGVGLSDASHDGCGDFAGFPCGRVRMVGVALGLFVLDGSKMNQALVVPDNDQTNSADLLAPAVLQEADDDRTVCPRSEK